MSAISSLFARMLALMDDVLTYFVLYSAPSSNADFCNPLIEATQGNAWVTPCGESFLQNVFELWQLVNELVHPFQTGMAVVAGFLGVS